MADTGRVRLHLQPASGSGAAPTGKRRAHAPSAQLRLHEQIFQVEPGLGEERGVIMEKERKAGVWSRPEDFKPETTQPVEERSEASEQDS